MGLSTTTRAQRLLEEKQDNLPMVRDGLSVKMGLNLEDCPKKCICCSFGNNKTFSFLYSEEGLVQHQVICRFRSICNDRLHV